MMLHKLLGWGHPI